jgi:hypothetical protein
VHLQSPHRHDNKSLRRLIDDIAELRHVDEGFSARMDYVLSGGVVSSSAESVGEWWEERSRQMINRIQPGRKQTQQPPMQRLASAHAKMMNNITLPEQPLPEVDFYDAAPIAVSSSSRCDAGGWSGRGGGC